MLFGSLGLEGKRSLLAWMIGGRVPGWLGTAPRCSAGSLRVLYHMAALLSDKIKAQVLKSTLGFPS